MTDTRTKSTSARILIVEDELDLLELIVWSVERIGHQPFPVTNGLEALKLIEEESFDLILLDIMLPGLSGQEICKAVRQHSDLPIIVLSALGKTDTVVEMLELGADEYITKPFSFQAVEAQIEAQLRRVDWKKQPAETKVVSSGQLELDASRRILTIGREQFRLSQRETSLLHFLIQNAGSPIDTSRICEYVWGKKSRRQEATLVQTTIQRLRTKIERNPSSPRYIVTVRGYGYKVPDDLTF